MRHILLLCFLLITSFGFSQSEKDIYSITDAVSAKRIEKDIQTLVDFGTRHTFSDTLSETRGIGAARRWIKAAFEEISKACDGCLEVFYQRGLATKEMGSRVPFETYVVNVVAIQRGTKHPNRIIMMSGDIDSRATDVNDYNIDAPGANDNASGMAGALEAARVLSQYRFENSIAYVGLSGEEQGLFGGIFLAEYAQENNWEMIGVLNNDMIGNVEGQDGVIDNRSFRIFAEAHNPLETERDRQMKRFYGGEVDGDSRQLGRYVYKTTQKYMPEMNPMLIYRLDRFGRGGHHKPFADVGFPAIRIMEAHEMYDRQHQDIRTENGTFYGDVIEYVDFEYAAKLTAVNAINMASLAWASKPPLEVKVGGIMEGDTHIAWKAPADDDIVGYKIYWRDTTSSTWEHSRYVGNVTKFTLQGMVVDNFYYGVSSLSKNGFESPVVFPSGVLR